MKQLTKAEEEIMQILWELKQANVASIIDSMPNPKPAYNTVSTIVRILESKGFVDHKQKGKGYNYFPVLEKETYSNQSMKQLMNNYFNGSFQSMVSFFIKKNDMSSDELESIMKEINKNEKS
ncbi:BlaI/MecI/CopY family transcriptional regulator [Christiangramia echinicola]|uniref:BlaI/MecI/CopY family transcriptional regulator n=1 Tax=Christiangramia echinicola TaxID=279359 RepID=UPI000406685D|nr:BlaI/MecI/CopY family transcriptional regulator [Christiangramia echinicola]